LEWINTTYTPVRKLEKLMKKKRKQSTHIWSIVKSGQFFGEMEVFNIIHNLDKQYG
jgi:hypothetical protein